jgi:signal transduction histidine kinase
MAPLEVGPADQPPEANFPFNQARHVGNLNPANASWQLLAKHQLGSIEAAVDRTRLQNLAIGFGMLLLMAVCIITLISSAQRARALALQQMEFVAGVSHELRSPLAVIQSAGYNLARGVAVQTEKVRQYGTVIQAEARRLSDMVEQILSFAGIQSGTENYQFCPIEIGPLVQKLLADYQETFEKDAWTIEQHFEDGLPPVAADERTLQSAIRNLVENALKYAASGKWLSVTATAVHKQAEVVVMVEDHGPGIDPADLPHLFEPFYRGRKVLASAVPGAGLGLSLLQRHLKAHGGHVKIANSPGGGAAFALYLPVFSEPRAKGD